MRIIYLNLVIELKLLLLYNLMEFAFKHSAGVDFLLHKRVEVAQCITPRFLRLVHGDVCW